MAESDIDPMSPASHRRLAVRNREDGPSRKRHSDIGDGASNSRRRTREPSPPAANDDDDAYDPNQSLQDRRRIGGKLRGINKMVKDNPDELLQGDATGILDILEQSNDHIKDVKQTTEATIDARNIVMLADLSARKAHLLTSGTVANGVDVDEFVSKCISYMRRGGGIENDEAEELSSTQRQRRQPHRQSGIGLADEDDVGDEGDMENWAHLGRFAATPSIRRPALPGFLMGPLSIEKKARKTAQRSAPFKISNLREVRPEELRAEDFKKSDKNDLPSLCKKIYDQLEDLQRHAQDQVELELEEASHLPEDEQARLGSKLMNKYALRSTGGIDLVRFVVNPNSFGQTVENMFYVSFLIREGSVKLQFDEDGLPSLEPTPKDLLGTNAQQRHGVMRHQAIMSIDMPIWREMIDAFGITEPMIPHREEEDTGNLGARGWYT